MALIQHAAAGVIVLGALYVAGALLYDAATSSPKSLRDFGACVALSGVLVLGIPPLMTLLTGPPPGASGVVLVEVLGRWGLRLLLAGALTWLIGAAFMRLRAYRLRRARDREDVTPGDGAR